MQCWDSRFQAKFHRTISRFYGYLTVTGFQSSCHGRFLDLHLYFLLFLTMSFQHLFVTPASVQKHFQTGTATHFPDHFESGKYVALCLSLNSRTRAIALYCLLPQAVRSLMAQEKQMSASQPLVFLLGTLHYTTLSLFLHGYN